MRSLGKAVYLVGSSIARIGGISISWLGDVKDVPNKAFSINLSIIPFLSLLIVDPISGPTSAITVIIRDISNHSMSSTKNLSVRATLTTVTATSNDGTPFE